MRGDVVHRRDSVALPSRALRSPRQHAGKNGFTLIELVVTLIVVGILAVVAIPRFKTSTFDTVGFYQEAVSAVRYAQKEAVAKRRVVCVGLTASTVTVSFAKGIGSFACDTSLTSPRGVSPFVVTAKTGVTLASVPAIGTLYFDPLGRPFDSAILASAQRTISITGDGTQSFVIEPETGYVH